MIEGDGFCRSCKYLKTDSGCWFCKKNKINIPVSRVTGKNYGGIFHRCPETRREKENDSGECCDYQYSAWVDFWSVFC
jgi:hypothetical protein